ncbi:MAG: FeoB small GTPase domain-containing protein [Christensenellaceae bacterium]
MIKVLLIGNGNSGKTTVFNALTGAKERTGNWFGVTVNAVQKKVGINGEEFLIKDLPGVVSFDPTSLEEKCVTDELNGGDYDVIVNVVDINNFEYSVKLTEQLLNHNKPVIVFFNFFKSFIKKKGFFDLRRFFELTNARCVLGDAVNGKDIKKLKELISETPFAPKKINASELLKKCYKRPDFSLSKFDEMLFDVRFGTVFYALIIFAAFYLSFGKFGIGKMLADGINYLFESFNAVIETTLTGVNADKFLTRLITDGILNGVESVLQFIPQIAILDSFLILLEQTGIIARISYIYDGLFSRLGLNGKAIFALICGFGCTTIGLNLTNGLDNSRIKNKVCLALPNVICSAKIPVFLYFANLISTKFVSFILPFCYVLSVVSALVVIKVFDLKDREKPTPLILEIPRLLAINVKTGLKPLINNIKEFIIKITSIVMLVSVATFLMTNLDLKFGQVQDISQSMLFQLSSKLKFLLYPIGIDSWQLTSSLIFGLFAKEAIISTISITAFEMNLNLSQIIAITVFIIFYTPCFTALFEMKRQIGLKYTCASAFLQLVMALLSCYAVYFALNNHIFRNWALLITVAAIILRKIFTYENNNRNKNGKTTKTVSP